LEARREAEAALLVERVLGDGITKQEELII
jgi:hypothetical protein